MPEIQRGIASCAKKMAEYLKILTHYCEVILPVVEGPHRKRLKKVFLENCLIRVYSYFENYNTCLLYQAMISDKDRVVEFFKDINEVKAIKHNWTERYQKLKNYAAKQASLGNPDRFKKCFKFFFGFEFFKNQGVEDIILDFHKQRNILLHSLGFPAPTYLEQINNKDLIKPSPIIREYGMDVPYELNLTQQDIVEVLLKIGENTEYHSTNLQKLNKNSPTLSLAP